MIGRIAKYDLGLTVNKTPRSNQDTIAGQEWLGIDAGSPTPEALR